MEYAKNSTPIRHNGRESLALIRPNTVIKLVNAFSKNNRLSSVPAENNSPVDINPIVGQTAFFNELSSIHQSPECGGEDSGFESMASRRRANTLGTKTNNQQMIIEKYLKFPNFKWSQLKYFGISNPRDYMMSSFNIDLDSVGELSSYATITNLDSNGGENTNINFIKMRKRSQSFAVDKVSETNAKKRKVQNEDFAGAESTKKQPKEFARSKDVVKRVEKKFNGESAPQVNSVDPNVAGSSDVPKTSKRWNNVCQAVSVKDLKLRIQKSIQSFDRYREVRKPSSSR